MAGFEDEDAPIDAAPMKRPGKGSTAAKPATSKTEVVEKIGNDLVELVTDKPIEVLLEQEKADQLFKKIEAEIDAFVPDLSTQAGRGRIKSLHYKIVRTRTTLDDAGKDHTQSLRDQVDAVNFKRRDMRDKLGKLEERALKPLTDWEAAEAARLGAIESVENAIKHLGRINPLATSADIQGQIDKLAEVRNGIEEEVVGTDERDRLQSAIEDLTADMVVTLEIVRRREEEAAEAQRLREENERLKAQIPPARAEAPAAEPIRDQQELPPLINSESPPAAESPPADMSPVKKARRQILPLLMSRGMDEPSAKDLILAIERGEIPGLQATYVENDK